MSKIVSVSVPSRLSHYYKKKVHELGYSEFEFFGELLKIYVFWYH